MYLFIFLIDPEEEKFKYTESKNTRPGYKQLHVFEYIKNLSSRWAERYVSLETWQRCFFLFMKHVTL